MKYSIIIRENETGECRTKLMRCVEWDDDSLIWLTEGNYGCDCNRALEFCRAGGMTEKEINVAEVFYQKMYQNAEIAGVTYEELDRIAAVNIFRCGDSRYTITEAILEDGRRIKVDGNGT